MQSNYKAFVDRMISRYEGGYCWDKEDPGGPTKYGITCYDLAEHRGQRMTSMAAWAPMVRDMTLTEAEDIYEHKYASAVSFADLPSGVDAVMMDYAVNSGIGRANRVARALCKLSAGTTMDHILLDQIKLYPADKFIDDMCDERLRFMHAIRGGSAWQTFGKGWGSRVADLRQYGHSLAKKVVAAPAPDLSTVPTPKATNTASPTSSTATTGTVIATGTAAGSAHMWGGVPIWAVCVAVAVAAIGFIAYEVYKGYKAHKANEVVHV